jgi:hypothetical protein
MGGIRKGSTGNWKHLFRQYIYITAKKEDEEGGVIKKKSYLLAWESVTKVNRLIRYQFESGTKKRTGHFPLVMKLSNCPLNFCVCYALPSMLVSRLSKLFQC